MSNRKSLVRRLADRYLFLGKERSHVRRAVAKIGEVPRFPSKGKVLVDVQPHSNELMEQLALARYFCERTCSSAIYYQPNTHLVARKGPGAAAAAGVARLSRGARLARRLGIEPGLHSGFITEQDHRRGQEVYRALKAATVSRQELVDFTFGAAAIGVAVYDTYLRVTGEPTVDLDSPTLDRLMREAALLYGAAERFFAETPVHTALLGHSVYSWRIVSDLAIASGAQVYVTYNTRYPPLHSVNDNRGLQSPNHLVYRERFEAMPPEKRDSARAEGLELLQKRVSGDLDEGVFYMSRSAYAEPLEADRAMVPQDGRKPLVIMLHSFLDSPHFYESMLFADFYEWVVETLRYAETSGMLERYHIILKPHPAGLPRDEAALESIARQFPFAIVLPKTFSNKAVQAMHPAAIVSVYGTVAAEFSYVGIPVILCGDNPTISFSFANTARSREEYFSLLEGAEALRVSEEDRLQTGAFAYMQIIEPRAVSFAEYPFKKGGRRLEPGFVSRYEDFDYASFTDIMDRAMMRLEERREEKAVLVAEQG